jgi:hypothetical protein
VTEFVGLLLIYAGYRANIGAPLFAAPAASREASRATA